MIHYRAAAAAIFALMLQATTTAQEAYQGPIIDMHVHAYQQVSPLFGIQFTNPLTGISYTTTADLEAHKAWTFDRMKAHRIVKAVVDYNPAWEAEDPDRVIPAKGGGNLETLRQGFMSGELQIMAEMAPYYNGVQADDAAMDPYFELAESLEVPVGYHIYPGGPPGAMYAGYPGVRAENAHPMQIERVLVAHPKLKIYIMHAGWPYLEDMKALMYAHPQLYVDLGVISWALPRAEFHHFLKGLVDAGFGKRIMYGTDQMVFQGAFDQAIGNINSASFLSMEQKADIFYNNAAAFLGLSPEEIEEHHLQAGNE
ncbi:amidohydrolase family protein [Robiginitalea sp. M366]|uniref:amidohydrolase family protein n=1 Tax=Robiginitalea aestuariiviva TaxID=3036903 RepID=UPI00240E188A|nr:amidohydrolase family protein [Robiginitalea aestuariiviva]MDG1572021.1 amidohydrolase family protein [Robiginitalea aestuariiviva]